MYCLTGCGEEEKILYETNDNLLIKNNIEDVVEVFQRNNLKSDESKIMYYGIRKGKDWFALFDTQSATLLDEWYGKERVYVRPDILNAVGIDIYFDQLKNGEYIGSYFFYPDSLKQIVRLSDNQKVEYGFEYINDEWGVDLILAFTEDLFLRTYDHTSNSGCFISNFTGDTIVTDVNNKYNPKFYCGFQKDKVWMGHIDKNNEFQEIISTEKFERKRKIHVGYGKYEEYYIKSISLNETPLKTNWGYIFLPTYNNGIKADVFILHEEKLTIVPLQRNNESLRNWYNNSILV